MRHIKTQVCRPMGLPFTLEEVTIASALRLISHIKLICLGNASANHARESQSCSFVMSFEPFVCESCCRNGVKGSTVLNVCRWLGRARLQKDKHGSRVPFVGWLGKGDYG